ncbi:MAG: MBL fold metallo-hydrolase [Chloroflexi bacterium]|nr:MBL fold metallo-hydrolase [Chloroflexota bacterium]
MNLTFLGGADEVGASSTLVEIAGKKLLIDAGIRISPKTSRGIQNDQLPDLHPISAAGGPDFILVTHAHTDHTGALPLVAEQYPHVPVIATVPTVELTRILQADAQRIMRAKQEQEGELPIFDEIASQRLMDNFQTVEFKQALKLGEGLQVTYHAAGHIAGAATLVLESEEGVLVMSGDVSLNEQRAVVSAALPRIKADALVLESTYGGKLHANRLAEEKRLMDTLRRVTERGGKVLIPAFALGRAQEILQIILAHREELAAPVFADGMVRAVCRGYVRFASWLPAHTVKAAGDEHLFFRSAIRPVENSLQRDEIMRSAGAAVIVASSGMLTGGASAAYAKALASDERNAILLTGYQDEEAPGRFLQRMLRERQDNQEVAFNIDNTTVTLRCELGVYSLSAHADESELVSVVDALGAEDTMLVHGDSSARFSLATALRQRGRAVLSPRIGQTVELTYAQRPFALAGKISSGHETRPLDPAALWQALKHNADSYYSARELARMWWGDDARHAEVARILTADMLYFAGDWRSKDTFRVRTPAQVEKVQAQRQIMQQNPALIGKLIVLRDSNNRPRAAVVVNAHAEGFEAVVDNTKGRHYGADTLLWVIGAWQGPPDGKGMKEALSMRVKAARALQEVLLPFERRQALVESGQPVNPAALLPAALPEGVSPEIATLSITLALAADAARSEDGGLKPTRALEDGPAEMNIARQTALAAFPPEARLRKVGMEMHRKRLLLNFDFPARASDLYAEIIEQVSDSTGWDVQVTPTVNQQALGAAISEFLPAGARIVKGPSFFLDKGEVHVDVDGLSAEAAQQISAQYLHLTGFKLRLNAKASAGAPSATPPASPPENTPGGSKMEINAAYGYIRAALDQHGLYKCSLKQGEIVLAFISPQVGQRHWETIQQLMQITGYRIGLHPHPNQQQILQIAAQMIARAGWGVRKGPSIYIERGEVGVSLAQTADESALTALQAAFEQQTGYRLVVG